MNLFKICDNGHDNIQDVISGYGAGQYGGRWNAIGLRAIYCSEELLTCAAERGFYKIVRSLDDFVALAGNPKEQKEFVSSKLYKHPQKLVQFELKCQGHQIVDLTSEQNLKKFISDKNLGIKEEWSDLLLSNYFPIQEKTRSIGQAVYESDLFGMKVRSARADSVNVVLFPANIPVDSFTYLKTEAVDLSAVDVSGKKLAAGGNPDFKKVLFSHAKKPHTLKVKQYSKR